MKNFFPSILVLFCSTTLFAQVGIGTTTPNSTLDIRGSLSFNYRSVTAGTTLGSTDQALVFTGTTAATVTLPTAVGIPGRVYQVKNASATIPAPLLTIATTSAQTIDGLSSWTLGEANEATWFISDGANWAVSSQSLPSNTGNAWLQGGNSVSSAKSIGTSSNFDFPFITNNTEKMRLSTGGSLGIGTSSFDPTNPERLLVDAGSSTTSFNVISGKGTINSYLQLNIQNRSGGTSASSDVVATSDNGNETVNYVDMGINSSAYNAAGFNITSINDAYLYSAGNDFAIGNSTSGKVLKFFTGGTVAANERMRIDGSGNTGIGTTSPAYKLDVNGIIRTGSGSSTNGSLVFSNSTNGNSVTLNPGVTSASYALTLPPAQGGSSTVLTNDGTGMLSWNSVAGAAGAWAILGNAGTSPITNFVGTTDNQSLVFKANNQLSGKIDLPLNNALFGYQAGLGVTTGNNNTYIGYQSGYGTTSGLSNTGVGSIALNANSTGANNTALGFGALGANTTGSGNAAVGAGALRNSTNAASNAAFGNSSLTLNTTGAGNTALGNASGATNTTGANNTFIGNGADASGSGLSNATAIGYNVKAAASNTLILGGTGVNVGVSTNTFNSTNPEKLVVDAGTTSSVNAIVGKGTINNYLQLNIQNLSNGTSASSDVVATADNGNETTNYVDLGINSSANVSGVMGNANDAYLYNIGQNFLVGTGTAAKALVFMTGGTTQSTNERMRIDGTTGYVGIGTTNPGNKLEVNSGTGGVSGLRLKQLPSGAVLFMGSSGDVSQNNSNLYFDATNYRLSVGAGTSPASSLQVGGSMALPITTKTASYSASVNDHTILCNNTSGAVSIGLPSAAGITGRIYVIKKISAAGNDVNLATYFGVETIDGSTSYTITNQYGSIMIQSDGASWFILSKN